MISIEIKNVNLKFETDPSNFSPNNIDIGTLAMLSVTNFLKDDKVLDLGCGYGVVGILAGKLIGQENITMCDISESAVEQAKINAKLNQLPDIDIRLSDGLQNVPDNDFSLILSNPPYHADFSIPKHFIEDGYYVFIAEKRKKQKRKEKAVNKLSKKLQRKQNRRHIRDTGDMPPLPMRPTDAMLF